MVKISVIIATLERPSLEDCVKALKAQDFPREEYEILKATGGINEYEARNKAVEYAQGEWLAFVDDDTIPPPDYLKEGASAIASDPEIDIMDGVVEGDLWGRGWTVIDKQGWGIGCSLWVKKKAFLELGGFEVDWGLPDPKPRGIRSDTDLVQRAIKKGMKYFHNPKLRMLHPKMMQSIWDPRVEEKFYLRHREFCLKEFIPVDPRLCQFVLLNKIETDPVAVEYIKKTLEGFEKTYGIKLLPS